MTPRINEFGDPNAHLKAPLAGVATTIKAVEAAIQLATEAQKLFDQAADQAPSKLKAAIKRYSAECAKAIRNAKPYLQSLQEALKAPDKQRAMSLVERQMDRLAGAADILNALDEQDLDPYNPEQAGLPKSVAQIMIRAVNLTSKAADKFEEAGDRAESISDRFEQ